MTDFTITERTHNSRFDLWREIYNGLRTGMIKGAVRVYSATEVLTINAEFLPLPGPDRHAFKVVGGGSTLTPTAFGERLDRELRALQIGDMTNG